MRKFVRVKAPVWMYPLCVLLILPPIMQSCTGGGPGTGAYAATPVERWVGYNSSATVMRQKMTVICTLSPECKAYAEAKVAAWDAAKAAEREAAMTPSKPRGPIPEQAEFKKRLGEVNLMKEK